MTASVEAYLRRGRWLVSSMSQTVTKIWMGNGYIVAVPETSSNEELGQAIIDALGHSVTGIPHPKSWVPSPAEPLLRVAGVKGWNQFAKGTQMVAIDRRSEEITVTPQVSERGGSFAPLKTTAHLQAPDPAVLGAAVRRAATERIAT